MIERLKGRSLPSCLATALALGIFLAIAAAIIRDESREYLDFVSWGTLEEVESYTALVERYNQEIKPETPVRFVHVAIGGYEQKLLIQAAARDFPDVIKLHNGIVRASARRGLIEPLSPFIEQDSELDLSIFYPRLLASCRYQGRLYALPNVFSTLVLYFNKDHFDAEGLDYPDSTWTWNRMVAAAKRLMRRNERGEVTRYGVHADILMPVLIHEFGQDHFSEDFTLAQINTAVAKHVMQVSIDMFQKHDVTWDLTTHGARFDEMFTSGRLSMIVNGRWASPWFAKTMRPGSFDVAPVPRLGPRHVAGLASHFIGMSAQSNKKAEAWAFMKYLCSEEAQQMLARDGNNIPAVRTVAESDFFLENDKTPGIANRVFLDEMAYARTWRFQDSPYIGPDHLVTTWNDARERIYAGVQTVDAAFADLEAEWNRVIRESMGTPAGKPFVGSALFYLLTLGVITGAGLVAFKLRGRAAKLPAPG